ncbi:Hypothetical protein CINCED_3A017579 [Cinara cedri]|uniref:Uncharacterized protein n=1 Tax=Cinara cedri TaxID=506608 RepID=A0A5E4M2X9_9HEMI|nr:Hypothetical protein CINCED_3A017579 [Cinara cedri]
MASFAVKTLFVTALVCLVFDSVAGQQLETFRVLKHQLEDIIARKTNVAFDVRPDVQAMISGPIVEWNAEAVAAIAHGTELLMDSFRLAAEDVQSSVDVVKSEIENDKKTKKTV